MWLSVRRKKFPEKIEWTKKQQELLFFRSLCRRRRRRSSVCLCAFFCFCCYFQYIIIWICSDVYIFSKIFILTLLLCLLSRTKCSPPLSLSLIEWASAFSSLFHSITLNLSLREFCLPLSFALFKSVCESYVLNLAPFYVKYIEHSLDIILSIFCMSSMMLLFCLSFSLFVEAFHSDVYRTEKHLCVHVESMLCYAMLSSST